MQRRPSIVPSLLAALAVMCGSAGTSRAGGTWSVGIGFGTPCYPRHYCAPYYYRPYPLYYYAPAPVVIAPAPVVVQPAPLVQQAPPVVPPPETETAPPPRVAPQSSRREPQIYQPVSDDQNVSANLRQLADANEGVRLDSVTQLGRSRAVRAVDPLAATLAGDQSPAVREAAARALGLIGSPKALPALHRAVQVDGDHDVRKAAQFSIEIIQTR